MDDYFIRTKSKVTRGKVFDPDGAKHEELLAYYSKQPEFLESSRDQIDDMFQEWYFALLAGFNVAVTGRLSKFRLIETFKARYLDSNKLPALNSSSPASVVTIRLHGDSPVSMEKFNHAIFGIVENVNDKSGDIEKAMKDFTENSRRKKIHHIFIIHSFDKFYEKSQEICRPIFLLARQESKFIHLLISTDHIYSGMILNSLKFDLNLRFYNVRCDDSFFYERSQAAKFLTDDENDAVQGADSLQSLLDLYQALQPVCRQILLYIMNDFIGKSSDIEPSKGGDKKTRSSSLEFDRLLKHCQSNFWLRRENALRDNLQELTDHRIIEISDSGKTVNCVVNFSVCKKFIDQMSAQK